MDEQQEGAEEVDASSKARRARVLRWVGGVFVAFFLLAVILIGHSTLLGPDLKRRTSSDDYTEYRPPAADGSVE